MFTLTKAFTIILTFLFYQKLSTDIESFVLVIVTNDSAVIFSWSEPVSAPADLEIGDEQWQATEEKLTCLVSDRLPRPQNIPSEAPPAIEPLYQPENDQPVSKYISLILKDGKTTL